MPASDVPFLPGGDGLPVDYRLRAATADGHVELSPADGSTARPPDGWPVWLVGEWNPAGIPLAVNRQRHMN